MPYIYYTPEQDHHNLTLDNSFHDLDLNDQEPPYDLPIESLEHEIEYIEEKEPHTLVLDDSPAVHSIELAESDNVIDVVLDNSGNTLDLDLSTPVIGEGFEYWSKTELVPMTAEDIYAITGVTMNAG